ncbi:hypothetical protein [Microcystis phage Mel-JY01]
MISLKSLIKHRNPKTTLRETVQRLKEEDEAEAELEKAFSDAFNSVMSDFSSAGKEAEQKVNDDKAVEDALKKTPELQKVANESYRRINSALTENNKRKQQINEVGFLFAVGIALAIPRIVELIGKLVSIVEKKLGGKSAVGEKLQHAGHEMHHMIISFVEKGLKFIPGFSKLPADKQEKIAHTVMTVIVAMLAVYSGAGAIEALTKGDTVIAGIEAALAAVKSDEVGITKFLSSAISKIIA